MESLTSDQRVQLDTFREITANAHDPAASVQLLASCNWDVEQALQLHWATADDGGDVSAATAASSSLGAPLLSGGAAGSGGAAASGDGIQPHGHPQQQRGFLGRIVRGVVGIVARVGGSVIHLLGTFLFGPGGDPRLGAGSGAAFARNLNAQYGGPFPRFSEGSFAQALQQSRRDLQLLVIYLHSDNARHTGAFCTQVLTNEFVRSMLDDHFVLWGGDIAWMESHNVAQMIHARQYPCFCVLLPTSPDEVRVIGMLHGEVVVDGVIALLTTCMEEMETHRAEIAARQEQHSEDRMLREQQNREYEESLAADRAREEERRNTQRQEEEQRQAAEAAARLERERLEKIEAEKRAFEERRRQSAKQLEAVDVSAATARIAMRLPTGQRVQRNFAPSATLKDVYAWADCVAYLAENAGKGIEIAKKFELKTAFPSKVLTEMDSTVAELQLAGAQLLLANIEEDDDA